MRKPSLLIIAASLIILSCAGYKNDGKKITYSVSRSNHIAFGIASIEVKNADPKTFEELDDSRYGKDSNNVFFDIFRILFFSTKLF